MREQNREMSAFSNRVNGASVCLFSSLCISSRSPADFQQVCTLDNYQLETNVHTGPAENKQTAVHLQTPLGRGAQPCSCRSTVLHSSPPTLNKHTCL